jgi:hypothetical protein
LEKNRNIEKEEEEEGWNCAAGNRALSFKGKKPNNKQKSKALLLLGKRKRGNTRKQDNCFFSSSRLSSCSFLFRKIFLFLSLGERRHASRPSL